MQAGGDPARVVFSGVGKTRAEIEYALDNGSNFSIANSEAETEVLAEAAEKLNKRPSVALRVNPDIKAETHPYIATGMHQHKFASPITEAQPIYERLAANPRLTPTGISCHIGSQIFDSGPFLEALDAVTSLAERLQAAGLPIRYLDLGGGLAVAYRGDETTPSVARHLDRLAEGLRGKNLKLMLEPGRSIVGPAGVLLTTVLYRKHSGKKEFVVVDAGMNDLIRPSLYNSHHEIVPLMRADRPEIVADVVGPVCETGDSWRASAVWPRCIRARSWRYARPGPTDSRRLRITMRARGRPKSRARRNLYSDPGTRDLRRSDPRRIAIARAENQSTLS